MSRSQIVAMAASVLVVSLLVLGCGSKSSSPDNATTTSTSTTPSSVATDSAVWPFVTDATRYSDPVKAAHGFAVEYLGFVNPVVGAFMQGDGRSGEVEIRPSSTGPETIVMVRELSPGGTWWVVGAATANLQLQSPNWNASIASPVTLSGESSAFEATVNVEIRQDGTLIPLAAGIVMGGSMGEIGPFSKAVSFAEPTGKRGAIVLKTLSAKDGDILEASVLRIQFTRLPDLIKRALDTGKLYQLGPYLAPSVEYAIAASGAFGTVSREGAMRQLSYVKDERGHWNFAIVATTLESFKSGDYRRYLSDDTYFGVSPGKHFLSVRVNTAGQVDQIFMAINTDLLK